jgi:YD repeat-containing protein
MPDSHQRLSFVVRALLGFRVRFASKRASHNCEKIARRLSSPISTFEFERRECPDLLWNPALGWLDPLAAGVAVTALASTTQDLQIISQDLHTDASAEAGSKTASSSADSGGSASRAVEGKESDSSRSPQPIDVSFKDPLSESSIFDVFAPSHGGGGGQSLGDVGTNTPGTGSAFGSSGESKSDGNLTGAAGNDPNQGGKNSHPLAGPLYDSSASVYPDNSWDIGNPVVEFTQTGTPAPADVVAGKGFSDQPLPAGNGLPVKAANDALAATPLMFEKNVGQTDSSVQFITRASGYTTYLTSTQAVMVFPKPRPHANTRPSPLNPRGLPDPLASVNTGPTQPPDVIHMQLVGSNPNAVAVGEDQLITKTNYFIGNDSSKWHTEVPNYGRVVYHDVYSGIDLSYHANSGRQLEYDFIVNPGADVGKIRLAVAGAQDVEVDGSGNLVVTTPSGKVTQHAPLVYQQVGGLQTQVAGKYVWGSNGDMGFQVSTYDTTNPLIIDPVLAYSTYLGGSSQDDANGIAVDSSGAAYVTGDTTSVNFPITTGVPQPVFSGQDTDAFVTKLDPSGRAILYSTYYGGSLETFGYSIAIDGADNAYITGPTNCTDLPTVHPIQAAFGGGTYNAFAAKFNSYGSAITYATYLGGSADDRGYEVAVDNAGNAYITGFTTSFNFPTANALQPANGTGPVVKMVNGSGVWNGVTTVIPTDQVNTIAVDPTDPSVVYAGSIDGGVFKSADAGNTWQEADSGLTTLTVNVLAVDPPPPPQRPAVYAGTDQGVFKSTDGGVTWSFSGLDNQNVTSIASDPASSNIVYAASGNPAATYESTDAGNTWVLMGPGNSLAGGPLIAIDPLDSSTLYVAGGLYTFTKSVDGGATWTTAGQGLLSGGRDPVSVAIDPVNPSNIYVGTYSSGVYKSTDAGETFNPLNSGPSGSISAVAVAPTNPTTVYASNASQLDISHDGGNSWTYSSGMVSIQALAVNPGAPSTVYVGKISGGYNGFLTKISASGTSLIYSTYLGGDTQDLGDAIAVDAVGNAFVAGETSSDNFPTTAGAFENQHSLGLQAFVTKVNPSGTGLSYSTLLGGPAVGGSVEPRAIALDSSGEAFVTGYTDSSDFPTYNAVEPTYGGTEEAFVTKLNQTGSDLMYSTFLGGTGGDAGFGIAVDSGGNATVVGGTDSPDFPLVDPFQSTFTAGGDFAYDEGFVTKFDASGTKLVYSSYLGGSSGNFAEAVALDGSGDAYVAGSTGSTDFPVVKAVQPTPGGGGDGFITKIGNAPVIVPTFDAPATGELVQTVSGATGGDPMSAGFSQAGVRYADGEIRLPFNDLSSAGYGTPWGVDREWMNLNPYPGNTFNGSGMLNAELPYLVESGNSIIAVTSGTNARIFDWNGSNYVERLFMQDQLLYDSTDSKFILIDSTGNQIRFNDFSSNYETNAQGGFDSFTDPAGNTAAVVTTRTTDGQVVEVQRSLTGIVESYLFDYITSGPDAGLIQSVTLQRQASTVREVVYDYYGDGTSSDIHGDNGDLRLAILEDGSGNILDTSYFRYYTDNGGGTGYEHGLKMVLGPAAFARLVAAHSDWASEDDNVVAPFADKAFQYDSQQRVTQVVVAGAGSSTSVSSTGLGTYNYAYASSSNPNDFNQWGTKTTETLPDGTVNIVYTNAYGEVMLFAHQVTILNPPNPPTTFSWDTFRVYDSAGRVIELANPSTVTSYSDSYPDLLHNQNGSYQYLANNQGLITTYQYTGGYYQGHKIQQGQSGTPQQIDSIAYTTQSATVAGVSETVTLVNTLTRYRSTDPSTGNGTGGETTTYIYTFSTGSLRPQQIETDRPVISAAQNGPGVADQDFQVFDALGRLIWHKDAGGFLDYTAYDPATSAVVKRIVDVNTNNTSDFSNLPTGWTTPTGGGLHLITQIMVDALGRATETIDPKGNESFVVYNDPNHETRIYVGWDSTAHTTTGPTQDVRVDRPNGYVETLTMTATSTFDGNGNPTGQESIGNLQTLSRTYTNIAGQSVRTDDYFNLAGLTYSTTLYIGTVNTNYYTTLTDYDSRGRLNRTQTPTGTIDKTVYDGLGRVIETDEGTNDTPASSNMTALTQNLYDGATSTTSPVVGDSNLTQTTDFSGSGAGHPDRTSQLFYDWRDRLVARKDGVQTTETAGVNRPIFYTTYDNLDEDIQDQRFTGDGVTITYSNGVPVAPSASLLRTQTQSVFDDQRRVYQSLVFDVNQSTGAPGNPLTTGFWFDHRGNTIEQADPGGAVTKTQYDGAGRVAATYTTDGAGGPSWSAASSVASDTVLSQVQNTYDGDGNVILVTTKDRFHNETALGALGNASTAPLARVSYVASYFDAANRPTGTDDVGTNGGAAFSRPTTLPAANDTNLETTESYTSAGFLGDTIDPRGLDNHDVYDALGRVTTDVQGYTNGTPTGNSNKTTQYTYDGDNHVVSQTVLGVSGNTHQTTSWDYKTSDIPGSTSSSNDELARVRFPDTTTGDPSASHQVSDTLDDEGDDIGTTDENGNVHSYTYDALGRVTSDLITSFGAGVDPTINRIDTAYDGAGRPYLFTSYLTSNGNIANQVQDVYNGLGRLTAEYQEHSGAVTSGSVRVQYAYVEGSGANNSRQVSMTYPNGRVIADNYGSGLDSNISRLTSLSDGSTTLESYLYLGLGTVVERDHPQAGVNLTYIKQAGEPNGDAGDQYTGLDRFGRVVDQRWITTTVNNKIDRTQYGYDRNSNVLFKQNLTNTAFGELYHANAAASNSSYDLLNQMTAFARGTLSASVQGGILDTIASPSRTLGWGFDALGNFLSITTNGGTPQTRNFDQENRATNVGSSTLTYDVSGNTTTDDFGQTYKYDAWNRIVKVYNSSTALLAQYSYDGMGRRIIENTKDVRDIYFSKDWQVLEERVTKLPNTVLVPNIQYVWSPVYVQRTHLCLAGCQLERDRLG